jgi:hypothetical protein
MKIAGKLALTALLGMALAPPGVAAPADTEATTELRCILLSGNMASAPDPQARQAGMMMAFYFLGRLDKKFSAAELQKRLLAEAAGIDAEKLRAAATTCGEQLKTRGAFLEDLGSKLSAAAKVPAKKPDSKPADAKPADADAPKIEPKLEPEN